MVSPVRQDAAEERRLQLTTEDYLVNVGGNQRGKLALSIVPSPNGSTSIYFTNTLWYIAYRIHYFVTLRNHPLMPKPPL